MKPAWVLLAALLVASSPAQARRVPCRSPAEPVLHEAPPAVGAGEHVLRVRIESIELGAVRPLRRTARVEEVCIGQCLTITARVLETVHGSDPGPRVHTTVSSDSCPPIPVKVGDEGYVVGALRRWMAGAVEFRPRYRGPPPVLEALSAATQP